MPVEEVRRRPGCTRLLAVSVKPYTVLKGNSAHYVKGLRVSVSP